MGHPRCSWKNQDHKNHPIVKRLLARGWKEFDVAWASMGSSDAGWTVINTGLEDSHIFGKWMGFNIKEAIRDIEHWNKDFYIKNETNQGTPDTRY